MHFKSLDFRKIIIDQAAGGWVLAQQVPRGLNISVHR
jgi:hypothetical protein